jgi:protein-S-isoprenylcysteine O-methyltransferase Ste14
VKNLWLFAKNALFTLVVPGFVVGWVPLHWFERHPQWPAIWGAGQWAGIVLAVLGAAAFLYAQWSFASRGQGTPAPFDPPKKFVRRGLYKWVRNPMYLAILAIVAGETLFLRSKHIAVYLVCLFCALQVLVALWEENNLRFKVGAMYEDYKRDVPRWIPRKPKPIIETRAPFPDAAKRRAEN